jgi:N-methylhydantoinase A
MDSLKNLSEELGMNSLELAEGIIKIANATMQRALVKISVQRGYDPRDFTLVTYGGAGGLHACELARELGIKRVLIPENPGVLSAYGMILTDVIKDYSRSFMKSSKEINFNAIAEAFLPLENAAMSELVKEKFDPLRVVLARSIDLRYKRQSFELNVPFSKTYIQDFHRLHHERYGHSDLKEKVEIVNLRLEGRGVTDKPPTVVPDIMENKIEDSVIGETRIFYDGKESDAAIIDRKRLAPHNSLDGPVLITEYTATTFIPPGFSMRVNSYGGIEIW